MRYKITEELSRTTEAVTLSITNFHEYCSILNSVDANNKRLARAKAARISQSTSTNSAINQKNKAPMPFAKYSTTTTTTAPVSDALSSSSKPLEIARYGSVPPRNAGRAETPSSGPKCYTCGQYGHISPDCPTKNKATEIKGLDKDEEVADEEIERQRRMSRKKTTPKGRLLLGRYSYRFETH